MAESTEIKALKKISKAGRGSLFFAENFLSLGNAKTVGKALERLTKQGELVRVARGIYVRPEIDPVIGPVTPGIETIAEAIARRDKARIIPTGIYALNRLGLSEQVPMTVVYLTDGADRKVKIGKRTITFKRATPKNVAAIGDISSLVIQALKAIGKSKVSKEEINKIQQLLKKEKNTHLQHDIRLAPDWIRRIMQPVLNDNTI
ncbi:MAG: type IV toxin-antitoxin system AbiEi family antitoxin domain-containing protein [Bacteroidetes bacterium]|nr:type IV toxin-antitoxin system AbiEi family antitoxin domain-containing protein [Bacteroidota bacterium]MBK8144061.1 type IV toxin-antitoxin system AbiEi family antitoxin domain-containing protein [Bacteroidota bacterium]